MLSFKEFGKKIKRKVGHSLPNRVRSGLTALVVTGKMHSPENKETYKKFRTDLLSNKHKLPKFKDS